MTFDAFLQEVTRLDVIIKIDKGVIRLSGRRKNVEDLKDNVLFWKDELLRRYALKTPYIDLRGDLIIPCDGNQKYHYWAGGQSLEVTLKELNVSKDIWEHYISNVPYWEDIKK